MQDQQKGKFVLMIIGVAKNGQQSSRNRYFWQVSWESKDKQGDVVFLPN